MLDASGKFPSGITSGTASDLGAYDQCLDIAVPDDFNPSENLFQGQYCGIEARPPLPRKENLFYRMDEIIPPFDNFTMENPALEVLRKQAQMFYLLSFRIGICVPSSCTKQDIQTIAGSVSKMIGLNLNVNRCEVKKPLKLENDQIAILSVVGVLVLLCAIATIVDVLTPVQKLDKPAQNKPVALRLLLSFSVPRNVRNLLDTSSGGKTSVNVLHGLKFLSITWVILGHTYLYLNWQILRNQTKSRSYIKDFAFQAVVNAFVSVDSFFFASGFLISYLTILHVDKNGRDSFKIPLFIFRRLWRFLPATAMLVGMTVLLPFAGSGPIFHETIDILVDNCRARWWANLIFVNNFFFSTDACQPNTWYTACDVQLLIISISFLLIVFRSPKWSLPFAGLMILGSVVSACIINVWQDLPPALMIISPDPEGIFTYWYYTHFLPHVHLGSYAIGLALGYFVIRHKDVKIKYYVKVMGWSFAVACNVTVLYSSYIWNGLRPETVVEATVYAGLHRPAWILGVAWMVYACINGFGGVVNSILSWPGFIPLSKLTFVSFLWHGTVIWVYMGNQEASIETNHLVVVYMFLGHLVVTHMVAFVFHLLSEAPFIQIERILLGGMNKRKPDTVSKLNGNGVTNPELQNGVLVRETGKINETYVYKL